MRYVLAILLPPLAVLTTGRILQTLLNIPLTILGWVPGVVHAALIVNDYKQEQRTQRVLRALGRG